LSEVNVKHVAVGIVSDTGRSHSSPLLSRNLIRCHDEIVFGSVGLKPNLTTATIVVLSAGKFSKSR
jgi:hypothetical protein